MASTPLRAGEKDRSFPRAYSELSLERRLLITRDTTINVGSISRVVVTGTTVAGEKQMSQLAKLLIFVAPPLLTLTGLVTGSALALALLVILAIGSATAGYLAPKEVIREPEKTHMLAVHTIDGGELRFITDNLTILTNARTLIANRMMETGDGLPIKIDFAKGLITTTAEAVVKHQAEAAEKAKAPLPSKFADFDDDDDDDHEEDEDYRRRPLKNGHKNGHAKSLREADTAEAPPKAPAPEPRQPLPQLSLSLDPHLGERGPIDTKPVERPPAERPAKIYAPADYSALVESIEQWHRTAAGSRGWEETADLLFELEKLAKSGSPAPEERARVRTLAIELSSRLSAYPPAIQLMQAVMRASSA